MKLLSARKMRLRGTVKFNDAGGTYRAGAARLLWRKRLLDVLQFCGIQGGFAMHGRPSISRRLILVCRITCALCFLLQTSQSQSSECLESSRMGCICKALMCERTANIN
jgi:hypothetical protein